MNWPKFFQAIMVTEENVLPIFIHSQSAEKIVGAVLVAESIFATIFGVATTAPAASPAPVAVSAD